METEKHATYTSDHHVDDRHHTTNDIESITVGQLYHILKSINSKLLCYIIGIILIYSFMIFQSGQIFHSLKTTITLDRPFNMTIKLDDKTRNFENISILRNTKFPLPDGYVSYQIMQYNEGYTETSNIGQVKVKEEKFKFLIFSDLPNVISNSYADESFQWRGHESNSQFREKFVNKSTIRRYYDDGWILEYRVDNKGRSIPSSFRWVKTSNSS